MKRRTAAEWQTEIDQLRAEWLRLGKERSRLRRKKWGDTDLLHRIEEERYLLGRKLRSAKESLWKARARERHLEQMRTNPKYRAAVENEKRLLARKKEDERRWQQLVDHLVDTGYRKLAQKCHPDVGGSHEQMLKLQAVREFVKQRLRGGVQWQL